MDLTLIARFHQEIKHFFTIFDREQFFSALPVGMGEFAFFDRIGLSPSELVSVWEGMKINYDPNNFYPQEYQFAIRYFVRQEGVESLVTFLEKFLVSELEEFSTSFHFSVVEGAWRIYIRTRPNEASRGHSPR